MEVPFPSWIILTVWRLAVVQTPMTASVAVGLDGVELSDVRWLIGTWMAIVWTFFEASELIPVAFASGMR